MKITPKETNIFPGHHIATWKCGEYTLRVHTHLNDNNYKTYEVFLDKKGFLPRIYPVIEIGDDDFGRLTGFTIQTTSYGDLNLDDYKKFMKDIRTGYNVAKALTEYFAKEN